MKALKYLSLTLTLLLLMGGTGLFAQAPNYSGSYSQSFQNGETDHFSRMISLDLQSSPAQGSYHLAKADGTDGASHTLTDILFKQVDKTIQFKLEGVLLEGEFVENSEGQISLVIYAPGEIWTLNQ